MCACVYVCAKPGRMACGRVCEAPVEVASEEAEGVAVGAGRLR